MTGFDNGTLFFNNGVDPRGVSPVVNQIGTNGKLLIGSGAAPYAVCNVPTGSTGVTVTAGAGTLDFGYTGSRIEQIVSSSKGSVQLCETLLPFDDSIPQITEGDQVLTATITPKHATNILLIEFTCPYGNDLKSNSTFALFQDATTDALASAWGGIDVATGATTPNDMAVLRHVMVAGTTAATTFQIRAGPDIASAGQGIYINGDGFSAGREGGGTGATVLTITEFNPGGAGTSFTGIGFLEGDTGGQVAPDGTNTINVVGGTGITVNGTPGTNTIEIVATATGVTTNDVTIANQVLAVNEVYVTNRVGGVAYVLPASATFGDKITIIGKAGLAVINQNALQMISLGAVDTTPGVLGQLSATLATDCLEMTAITGGAATWWRITNAQGNWLAT
jgi:hypothetical protein